MIIYIFQLMENDLFLWSDRNNNKHPLVNLQSNNCDFKNPEKFSDVATITQKDLLPITSVSYGPITYELQAANATIGPLICHPWNMTNQDAKNEDIHKEFIEMKEVFEESIEHIKKDMKGQKMAQRHTNETLEKFNGKLNGILVKWLNSTLGKSLNF